MTRIPLEGFPTHSGSILGAELGRRVSLPFMAFAGILIVVAYLAPFHDKWNQSVTFGDLDDDRAEVTAHEGALQKQIALAALGLVGAATLAFSKERLLQIRGPLGWICVAYIGWCAASILWTTDFSITLRRVIGLACEVLAGIAIAQRASPRQFAWLVFACTLTWLGLGVLAELMLGTFHPLQPGYRFMGVFYPNIMAANCVLLILSSLYLGYAVPKQKRLLQLVAGITLVFLVLTGSRTAMGTLIVLVALYWWIQSSVPKRLFLIGAAGMVIFCTLFLAALGEFDFSTGWASMGRTDHDVESLTGRVPLWQELFDYAQHRPLLGYGYGAFWTPRRIVDVAETMGWSPAYAHSTYVDLLVSVGLIGATLFIAAMVLSLVRAARLESRYAASGYGFLAMVIACVLVNGTLETNFANTSFMSFFGVCAVCFVLSAAPLRRPLMYANESLNGRSVAC